MTKKEQIEELYINALNNDEAPNVFADQILFLFGVSKSFYCWNKDCGMEQCKNICISCEKYKGNGVKK